MAERTVCPECGYSALRLEPPAYEKGHEGESARPTWSPLPWSALLHPLPRVGAAGVPECIRLEAPSGCGK